MTTIRRRVDEVDEDGRRRTLIVEEPAQMSFMAEEAVEEETPGPAAAFVNLMHTLAAWTGLALLTVLSLLGLRLGLQLAEANSNNNFVDFIYDISGPLIQPFQGIARIRSVDSGGFFDPAVAIAMGVYLLCGLLVIAAFQTMASGRWSGAIVHRTRVVREQ